jgi:hypothetical protein
MSNNRNSLGRVHLLHWFIVVAKNNVHLSKRDGELKEFEVMGILLVVPANSGSVHGIGAGIQSRKSDKNFGYAYKVSHLAKTLLGSAFTANSVANISVGSGHRFDQ